MKQPGEPLTIEFRAQHTDGSWRVLEATGQNLLDDPAVGGLLITSRDITEQRLADAALRESEERFRLIAETATDILFVGTGPSMRLEYISPAFERILGFTAEEAYADPAFWRTHTHPDDLGLARASGARRPARPQRRALAAQGRDLGVGRDDGVRDPRRRRQRRDPRRGPRRERTAGRGRGAPDERAAVPQHRGAAVRHRHDRRRGRRRPVRERRAHAGARLRRRRSTSAGAASRTSTRTTSGPSRRRSPKACRRRGRS